MDEISLIFGITGTGGVVCAIVMYALSKGFKSNCRAMKMEMNLDIHEAKSNDNSPQPDQNVLTNLTRKELEEIIVETLKRIHGRRDSDQSYSVNIVIPNTNTKQIKDIQHIKELEEVLLDNVIEMHYTPESRSRSGSEESHRSYPSQRSHRSHHSHLSHHSHKHKVGQSKSHNEEHIIIVKEQL